MTTATTPDGARIAYEATGDGPAIVLVHGITESRHSWDPLVGELARDHRVIALDLRGHGESQRQPPYDALVMAGDVRVVVDAVGATAPLLVGHSLGGAVVSMYGAAYEARGVVNVDQPLDLGGFKELLTSIEPQLRADEATFQLVISQIFESLYGALQPNERSRIASYAHPEQEVVLGVWDLILRSSREQLDEQVETLAAGITAPYLALHGDDPGERYVSWLQATVPSAIVDIWPGLGHYPHLVESERFLRRLRAFERDL